MVVVILQQGINFSYAQLQKDVYSFAFGYGYPNFERIKIWLKPDKINYAVSDLGPLHGKVSLCITKKIEVSINVNYVNYRGFWQKENSGLVYNYNYESSSVSGLLRCNIHEMIGTNVYGYWGCAIGGGNFKRFSYTNNPNELSFNMDQNIAIKSFETTLGIRVYFMKNFGVYAEIGYAKSILQAGLVLTFSGE